MAAIKQSLSLCLSFLLLFSSIPSEAAGAIAGCSLSWTDYKACLNSRATCKYPNSFANCNTNLKLSEGYKNAQTNSPAGLPWSATALQQQDDQLLSYAFLYSEGKSSIPAKYSTPAGKNAFLGQYVEARLDNQPNPAAWADAQMTKAKQAYQADNQQAFKNNMYADAQMSVKQDQVLQNSNARNAQLDKQWYEQGLSKKNQADLALVTQNKEQAANEANTAIWEKHRKDNQKNEAQLEPLRYVARLGMHSEYSYLPVMVDGKPKTDEKGKAIYGKPLIKSAPNDPLYLDEIHIIYKGKPAITSMTAIGRDLLDLKSTTNPSTQPGVAKAAEILLAILDCAENPQAVLQAVGTRNTKQQVGCTQYVDAAVSKLGFIGPMLAPDKGQQVVAQKMFNRFARMLATDKDPYMRIEAAYALGMMGHVAPDQADPVLTLLAIQATNDFSGQQVSIGGGSHYLKPLNRTQAEDFSVRVAALMAIASIGTKDAIDTLASIPGSQSLFPYNRPCKDCDRFYYPCKPVYRDSKKQLATDTGSGQQYVNTKAWNKVYAEWDAANDGAVQCSAVQMMSDFLGTTLDAAALKNLRDLAFSGRGKAGVPMTEQNLCNAKGDWAWPGYQTSLKIANPTIQATLILTAKNRLSKDCLKPIAKGVNAWKGNPMKLPCEIVNAARSEVGGKQNCEQNMLWYEAINIVINVIKGFAFAFLLEKGAAGAVASFTNAARSCQLLYSGLQAVEVGMLGYKVQHYVKVGKETEELAIILWELRSNGKESGGHSSGGHKE